MKNNFENERGMPPEINVRVDLEGRDDGEEGSRIKVFDKDDESVQLILTGLEQAVDALLRLEKERLIALQAAIRNYHRLDHIPQSLQRKIDFALRL